MSRFMFVYGWRFRAPGCVLKHTGKVRSYFKLVEDHAVAGSRRVEVLRRNADVVVGVHVRHGDYQELGWWQVFLLRWSRYAEWRRDWGGQPLFRLRHALARVVLEEFCVSGLAEIPH